MLNQEQNDKFVILCKEIVPVYMRYESTDICFSSKDKDIFSSFYKYESDVINFNFARLHYEINEWIKQGQHRLSKGNFYILSAMVSEIRTFKSIIEQFKTFFKNCSFNFKATYGDFIIEVCSFLQQTNNSYFPDNYTLPTPIIDEPVFSLVSSGKLANIKYLIFGAAKTKPDIRVSDVLDGNLDILNHNDVLVYDDEIKDSILYADFNIWWEKSKSKYSWYKSAEQMNEIELKFANYYKGKYKVDNFPVLIPQVYLHYDPKDKEVRAKYKHSKALTFQRMDFLIIYKGKRVIIEIDGKTHTQENSLEQYSRQTEYDRTMKFLGYDVFRIGGYELTHYFVETVKNFFDNIIKYLEIE